MGRKSGKNLTQHMISVYITEEKYIYMKRLLMLRKKKLGITSGEKYPLSRFVRDIISEYIADNWDILEQLNKAFEDHRNGTGV